MGGDAKKRREKEGKTKTAAPLKEALIGTVEAAVEQIEERAGETLGEAVGDWVGEAAGEAIGAAVGETAGELVGAAAGPVGALAGGLVGLAAGKALDAAFRAEKPLEALESLRLENATKSEKSAESGKTEDSERTGAASRRKIAGSVASLAVAEADALGLDVEKLRTALKFWKEASSATAALADVGRWVAAEAETGVERLRDAFAGEKIEKNDEKKVDERNERDDGGAA